MGFLRRLIEFFTGGKGPAPAPPKPQDKATPTTPAATKSAPMAAAAPVKDGPPGLVPCEGVHWCEKSQLEFFNKVLLKHCNQKLEAILADRNFKDNEHLSPLDAAVLFAFVSETSPSRIMEIGSGYTSFIFRRALQANNLPAELIAIDPAPKREIYDLVDAHLQDHLKDVPAGDFSILIPGEIVLVDPLDHACTPGGDLEYLFENVLPVLKPGVIVAVMGVPMPFDYMASQRARGWNFQDRLIKWLADNPRTEILYCGGYLAHHHKAKFDATPDWIEHITSRALLVRIQ